MNTVSGVMKTRVIRPQLNGAESPTIQIVASDDTISKDGSALTPSTTSAYMLITTSLGSEVLGKDPQLPYEGRNLCVGSYPDTPFTGRSDKYSIFNLTNSGVNYIKSGEVYTITAELKVDDSFPQSGDTGIGFSVSGADDLQPRFRPTSYEVVQLTFTAARDGYLSANHFPNGSAGNSYIKWVKLTKGSVATKDYSPAPEDSVLTCAYNDGVAISLGKYQGVYTTQNLLSTKTGIKWKITQRGVEIATKTVGYVEKGVGIQSIQEYYLVYSSSSGVTVSTPGWSTSVPTMTSTNKYLWNYEKITYTDGKTYTTQPVLIGSLGDEGKGVYYVTEYYLASSSSSGVTTSTSGWTTSIQTIDSTKRYLWNYEQITYTDGSSTYTSPVIIGTYGDPGQTIVTKRIYQRTISTSAPSAPSSSTLQYNISTDSLINGGSWSLAQPSYTPGATNRYLWFIDATGTATAGNNTVNLNILSTAQLAEAVTMQDDMAKQFGFPNYADLVKNAITGGGLMSTGMLRSNLIESESVFTKGLVAYGSATIANTAFNEDWVTVSSNYGLRCQNDSGTIELRQKRIESLSSMIQSSSSNAPNSVNVPSGSNGIAGRYYVDNVVVSPKAWINNSKLFKVNSPSSITVVGSVTRSSQREEGGVLSSTVSIAFYTSSNVFIDRVIIGSTEKVFSLDYMYMYVPLITSAISVPDNAYYYDIKNEYRVFAYGGDVTDVYVSSSSYTLSWTGISAISKFVVSSNGLAMIKNNNYIQFRETDESDFGSRGVELNARYKKANYNSPLPFCIFGGYLVTSTPSLTCKIGYYKDEVGVSITKMSTGYVRINLPNDLYSYNRIAVSANPLGSGYYCSVIGEMGGSSAFIDIRCYSGGGTAVESQVAFAAFLLSAV